MGTKEGKHERRHDIDWLRASGMLMVFLFHCARFFNDEDWHAKNNQISFGMTVFVDVVAQWIMPLFFVLSGISSYFALSYLKIGKYINARVKRLAIPLIFGTLTHISLQVYIERVTHGEFSGSFIAFFPHYFDGFYAFGGSFAWMGLHLWYLEMLFIFSLITLPLFLWARKETTRQSISRAVSFFEKPGAIFLFALPLFIAVVIANLQPDGIGIRVWGGWSILAHLVFFMLGYLIASDLRFRTIIEKHRTSALALGMASTTLGFLVLQAGHASGGFYFSILRALNSWCWLAAILGYGSKYLSFNNRALKYVGEAVLPFYILHQTVIVTLGFYIADWSAGVMVKYIFLSTCSFAIILAIYDLAIKRINILRLVFGMKPRNRKNVQLESLTSEKT